MTDEHVAVKAPNFKAARILVRGTAPLVMHKFSHKAETQIRQKQESGSTTRKGVKRDAKDFDQDVIEATHYAKEGWIGVPAAAFRAAMIRACSLVGFKMTIAKMSVFVIADGYDAADSAPLVKLIAPPPERHDMMARTETGVSYPVSRPIWHQWDVSLLIRWDGDQFTLDDILNLLSRAGMQVGILEGRPFSKNSDGMGWGTFEVVPT